MYLQYNPAQVYFPPLRKAFDTAVSVTPKCLAASVSLLNL